MSDVPNYRDFCESFEPSRLTDQFDGDFATGINACVECCDRHVREERVALVSVDSAGPSPPAQMPSHQSWVSSAARRARASR